QPRPPTSSPFPYTTLFRSYEGKRRWFKIKNPEYSQREVRREMFNSFKGYNDREMVRELARVKAESKKIRALQNRVLWPPAVKTGDRKSTRLNSSHQIISYA